MSPARSAALASLALALLPALACGRGRPETPFGDDIEYGDLSDVVLVETLVSDGGRVDWSHARDLIALDFDAQLVHPLEPGLTSEGVLHPHFSADGASLTWSNMLGPARLGKAQLFGSWELAHADFVVDAELPTLVNAEALTPGDTPRFYENHGWSPAGLEWVFSANLDLDKGVGELNDIYLWQRADELLERFTVGGYNEHASFSPDGEQLAWISNAGNDNNGTDMWRARRDGSELERLTRLNTDDSGRLVAADLSWGPDGASVVLHVQDEVLGSDGSVVLIRGL